MDALTLSTTTSAYSFSAIHFFSQRISHAKKSRILSFPYRKTRKFLVFASKDEPKLDEWDKMELKFGRMIGEDPRITLAKIMGRKSNPDISYLEIEKLLDKKKGKSLNEDIEEIPFDVSDEKKVRASNDGVEEIAFDVYNEKKSAKSIQGLNLVRPVPKKGIKFEETNKPVERDAKSSVRPIIKATKETKSSVPDVILRKPSLFNEDDSMSGMKPNLTMKMQKEPRKERLSDMTLLQKPQPMTITPESLKENGPSDSVDGKAGAVDEIEDNSLEFGSAPGRSGSAPVLHKPEQRKLNLNTDGNQETSLENTELNSSNVIENNLDASSSDSQQVTDRNPNQYQETEQNEFASYEESATELQAEMWSSGEAYTSGVPSQSPAMAMDSVLQGKPKRLDRSDKATDQKIREEVILVKPRSFGNPSELENFLTASPITERENNDWARAEQLFKTGERGEVELISASIRGFAVSFGSLIGFLPYRNLAARWKFLAFESWLRRKGLNPSNYRQNLGIIGKYEATSLTGTSETVADSEIGNKTDDAITSDMKLEDLFMIYDQEKLKFLSSFVGQKVKVGVVLADRSSRKLIFSTKPREKEEMVEKKRSLMARLSVGDVVKCCIKKITYFGVFVEVEGVPALIHQTEVSWDATLDPASYFKVGQIVDAKVHQLDFSMERIFLSLKEVTPDPLIEALEAVVGDHGPFDGRLEAAQSDTEWADVDSLIKELEQFDGIQSVSKGRYFLSPGLAPTFQVYMASVFEDQYKLLARAGNRIQEVIVQTSLSKEDVKSAILTCTNRVE